MKVAMAADAQHISGAGAICSDDPYGAVARAVAGLIAPPGGAELPPADIEHPGR
jgi:hypothetical protein